MHDDAPHVIDLAAVSAEETVDIALDAAIRQGMSRVRFLRRLDELARPGRNGIALIRRLVAERVVEQGLTESAFERLLLRASEHTTISALADTWR